MNTYQQTLYNDLMNLCQNSDAFYYVDQAWQDQMFRIFSYRLASYTEFQQPNAIECRGHTFRLNVNGQAEELVSFAMHKFWNDGEVSNHLNTVDKLIKRASTAYESNQLSKHLYERLVSQYSK